MEEISDICYITDEKYSLCTAVSILSLIDSVTMPVNVYIITYQVPETIINYFKSFSCPNVNIIIKEAELDYCEKVDNHIYISKTALLKFKIAEICNNLDKILYIDGDTLIFDNLYEVFKTDISEYYAGVVSDYDGMEKEYHIKLNQKNYFNSGVMLLNLKKIREDKLAEKLIEYKENKDDNWFMDQNTFNAVFNNNVKFLNPKYNMMMPNLKNCDSDKFAVHYNITKEEAEDLLFNNRYVILHLTNKQKPWNSIGNNWFDLWYYYFKKIKLIDLKIIFYDDFMEVINYQLVIYYKFLSKFSNNDA